MPMPTPLDSYVEQLDSVSNISLVPAARIHGDLVDFDFEVSQVYQRLMHKLTTLAFTQDAQNAVLVGCRGAIARAIWPRPWWASAGSALPANT